MHRMVAMVMAALILFAVAGAWAEEVSGKIQTINAPERVVVLEDGTQLWLAEGLPMEMLKEGSRVKAIYEERDGKKVATSMEVASE